MKRSIIVVLALMFSLAFLASASAAIQIRLWFPSTAKPEVAQKMADMFTQKTGISVTPKIAANYTELFNAMTQKTQEIAYLGSMVETVLWARRLGQPLMQAVDGRHYYGGLMIFPKGQNPESILATHPTEVAYTIGASSGEVAAKAATKGKAAIAVDSHGEAADAVQAGKAKAAFVKDIWWDDNKDKYPEIDNFRVPGISDSKNPDSILFVSKFVSPEVRSALMGAAISSPETFNANVIVPFDSSYNDFTLELMKKAGIDPLTYVWAH